MMYSYEYDRTFDPAMPVAAVFVTNTSKTASEIEVLAILDSGSDATALPRPILNQVQATYLTTQIMRAVTGHRRKVDIFAVTIRIGDHIIPGIKAIALEADEEPLIGRDVLNNLIVTLNGLAYVTEIQDF